MNITTNKSTNTTLIKVTNSIPNEGGIEPIIYNGQQIGVMGYASKADFDAQVKILQEAIDGENGDIYSAIKEIYRAAQVGKAQIVPDEEVTVPIDGIDYRIVLDYQKGTATLLSIDDSQEVASVSDLMPLDQEVAKRLLLAEAEKYIKDEVARERAACPECFDEDGRYIDEYDEEDVEPSCSRCCNSDTDGDEIEEEDLLKTIIMRYMMGDDN